MTTWIGLTLALVSALAVNWAYAKEHDAAVTMPRFSPRRPVRFVTTLLGNRHWRTAFAAETAGWLVYVAALRLAPISLVQAVCASGIAVLAFVSAGGHPSRLARREQVAVVVAFIGLVLLSLSLVGSTQADRPPDPLAITIWIASCAGGALVLALVPFSLARAAALGLAAGLLFADGDISAKLIGYGGAWLAAAVVLIACYALGTSILQGAFQHGAALTAAGLATLATNAVPIAAGFAVFGESLPGGTKSGLQIAAFASIVVSATFLSRAPTQPGGDQAGAPTLRRRGKRSGGASREMVGRADFEPAEWRLVCQAPTYAGLIVSAAQRGGFLWEALSIARAFADVRARQGESLLLDEICAERPLVEHARFRSGRELRAHGLDHIRSAIGLVELKGEPGDVDTFARFLAGIAERVARAYPETEEPVSAAEKEAIAEIRAAAGLEPRRQIRSPRPG